MESRDIERKLGELCESWRLCEIKIQKLIVGFGVHTQELATRDHFRARLLISLRSVIIEIISELCYCPIDEPG